MILSTLLNVATVIAISTSTPTTMIFKEPIQFVSAGKTGDFSLFINNNKKVIVIQPLKDIKASELVVLTDNKNYQFKIQIEKSGGGSYFQVEDGKINLSYTLIKKTDNYEIYEGVSSLMFKNISENEIKLNEESLARRATSYLPKGGSIYVDSVKVY